MSRPRYETKEHLKREYAVRDVINEAWNCDCKNLPSKVVIDYAVCRDGIIKAWVEIKNRNKDYVTSDYLMISLYKIMHGRALAKETGLPFFLVIKFNDGIYYYQDKEESHLLKWGGRLFTARDNQDQEPCYFIDISLFKRLA